jgi:DNA-binding transcriptional MerR regulator
MPPSTRLLTIGEFAAATQLSPKALRLYDEQRLLIPARVDTATGYRYYGVDQVHRGRLIRALREVGMPLDDIAACAAADESKAFALLARFSKEQDRRYAREKRALHGAISMLRNAPRADSPNIIERVQSAATVATRDFSVDRASLIERFRAERATALAWLREAGMEVSGAARCSLLEPLSDERTRLEILVPVVAPGRVVQGISLRQLPAARCAVVVIDDARVHASEISAATDTLFDWFDRLGHRALDTPLLALGSAETGLETEVHWAFEPARE